MNMKTIIICFALLVLVYCTTAQEQKITTDLVQSPLTADKNTNQVAMPKIKVEKDFFDFGEINQDESVSTEFRLKNIGDAPLLIRSAKGSCGCTVPEWPKEAVTAATTGVCPEKRLCKTVLKGRGKACPFRVRCFMGDEA